MLPLGTPSGFLDNRIKICFVSFVDSVYTLEVQIII